VSLGNCEHLGFFAGAAGDFAYWLGGFEGPLHVVFKPDRILVPSAAALRSALGRDDEARERMLQDFASWFPEFAHGPPTARPWLAIATLAEESLEPPVPVRHHAIVDGSGQRLECQPGLVFLSLANEFAVHLRHRELGYVISIPGFQFAKNPELKPALLRRFDPIRPTAAETRENLAAAFRRIRQVTGAQVAVLNVTTDPSRIFDWSQIPNPEEVAAVRSMDLNLALWEAAEQERCWVVDVEALAIELGIRGAHPDRVHPSAALDELVRGAVRARVREWREAASTSPH
jgi:hypothetical protein